MIDTIIIRMITKEPMLTARKTRFKISGSNGDPSVVVGVVSVVVVVVDVVVVLVVVVVVGVVELRVTSMDSLLLHGLAAL